MGALSRSIALYFDPNSILTAGNNLVLGLNPTAISTTRQLTTDSPADAQAFARGIGAGSSRFLTDLAVELTRPSEAVLNHLSSDHGDQPADLLPVNRLLDSGDSGDIYNSYNLLINSGGGQINGTSDALSVVSTKNNAYSNAEAISIGLANIQFFDRFGGLLAIGSSAAPLTANSLAVDESLLGDVRGAFNVRDLKATSIVRGLEGGGTKAEPGNLFYGQPSANVLATAAVDHRDEAASLNSVFITADAVGLENATVYNVPKGSGNNAATIAGEAVAKASMVAGSLGWDRLAGVDAGATKFLVDNPLPNFVLTAQAVGIDESTLFGAPTLNSTIKGSGLAQLDLSTRNGHSLDPGEVDRIDVVGIGIRNTDIYTHTGNDLVIATGGVFDDGVAWGNRFNHLAGQLDAAGFDNTTIYTNQGNDTIIGLVMSEADTGIDANKNGIIEANIFLDQGALNPAKLNGFDGFRNSVVDAGTGNDSIRGASNNTALYGSQGDDLILLDRAKDTSLWGGLDNDTLSITGDVRGQVTLWGDLGNDLIRSGRGSDGVHNLQSIDGGMGQDLMYGNNTSVDTFLLGNGAASLNATSSNAVNKAITDPTYWNQLSTAEKNLFWKEGVLLGAQSTAVQQAILAKKDPSGALTAFGTNAIRNVDTINDFQAGAWRDTIEINGALANIDQATWQAEGSIFAIDNIGQVSVVETSSQHPNRIGMVVGAMADILKLGIGSPSIAYASDTRQLLYDADGNWSKGAISMGTINFEGGSGVAGFGKSNIRFGGGTGEGMGTPLPL